MTTFRCLKHITKDGKQYGIGARISFDEKNEKDEIARLERKCAIESLDIPSADFQSIIQSLLKVDGVTKSIAKNLVDAGINSVNKLGTLEIVELVKIKGISEKIAEKIFNAFVATE